MGLILVLLLLSNCKAFLRENIDLLLIKSNYIFLHFVVYLEILQCHILFPLMGSLLFLQYQREILYYDCHPQVQPLNKMVFE